MFTIFFPYGKIILIFLLSGDEFMEHNGKEQKTYHGVFGSCLILILIPLLLFTIVYLCLRSDHRGTPESNLYFALMVGVGAGGLFQLSCVLAGLTKGTFKVVVNRIKEFIENLQIGFKFSFKYYIENIKNYGLVFWIYFLIIGTTWGITIYGLIKSLQYYHSY